MPNPPRRRSVRRRECKYCCPPVARSTAGRSVADVSGTDGRHLVCTAAHAAIQQGASHARPTNPESGRRFGAAGIQPDPDSEAPRRARLSREQAADRRPCPCCRRPRQKTGRARPHPGPLIRPSGIGFAGGRQPWLRSPPFAGPLAVLSPGASDPRRRWPVAAGGRADECRASSARACASTSLRPSSARTPAGGNTAMLRGFRTLSSEWGMVASSRGNTEAPANGGRGPPAVRHADCWPEPRRRAAGAARHVPL